MLPDSRVLCERLGFCLICPYMVDSIWKRCVQPVSFAVAPTLDGVDENGLRMSKTPKGDRVRTGDVQLGKLDKPLISTT
jgi:hypothetical protein